VLFVEEHEALLSSRGGAGDEGTRSDHAGNEWRDRLVSGRGDHWHQSAADATLEESLAVVGLGIGGLVGEVPSCL
jgi:hypothetical protein